MAEDLLRTINADLHIHTCLSPCAEPEMTPRNIVRECGAKGLHLIAICDHNAAENVAAVQEAAARVRRRVTVLGGMEITTKEEVHVLALVERLSDLLALQGIIYDHLAGVNDERRFGPQVRMDEDDQVIGSNARLLIGATDLALEEIIGAIHARRGLAIASHIDRERFGILGQLGFIPPGLPLDALEVSPRTTLAAARAMWPEYARYPMVTSSDAHRLEEIGRSHSSFVVDNRQPLTVAILRDCLAQQRCAGN